MQESPLRHRAVRAPLDLVFLLVAVAGLWRIFDQVPDRYRHNDFAHYYVESRELLAGANPYLSELQPHFDRYGFEEDPLVFQATNPPPLTALFVPFALLKPKVAFWAWTAVQLASLIGILLLTRALLELGHRATLYLTAAVLASNSLYIHLYYGQVQLLLGLMLLAGCYLLRQGRWRGAWALVGAATLLKLFPAPWFLWFLMETDAPVRDRARFGVALLAVGGSIVLIQLPLWRLFAQSASTAIFETTWLQTFNYTVPAVFARLGMPVEPALLLGLLAILSAYIHLARRRPGLLLSFSLFSFVAIVSIPLAWGHYYVMLIFPFAYYCRRLLARPTPDAVVAAFLGYLLVIYLVRGPLNVTGWRALLAPLPLYGALAVAGYLWWCSLRSSREPATAATRR